MEIISYIFWGVIAAIIVVAVTIAVIRSERKSSHKSVTRDIEQSRDVYKRSTPDDLDIDIRLMIRYGEKYEKYTSKESIHEVLFLKIKQLEKRIDSLEKTGGN